MRISPFVLVLLTVQLVLDTMGTYFSFRGLTGRRGAIFPYVFQFFFIRLLTEIMNVVQVLAPPTDHASARVSLHISNASTYASYSAFVVLVLGSFLVWGRGESN